ncbi:MAG: cytidine deaminase, homotetrameric [Haloquadratum sp. J07HQX50]|jgi:cytidine deaminase|nr:MAG: cytidine deaminase, homotetrameric [Haloquadratum sp. J07HQX50]
MNSHLVQRAREAHEEAYVPYSEYPVGAAIEAADGQIFTGCNIENVNYSNALHAEEVAIADAIKQGKDSFTRLAVSSASRDAVTPCGRCRQTLSEFVDGGFEIICDGGNDQTVTYTLEELFPQTMTADMLPE